MSGIEFCVLIKSTVLMVLLRLVLRQQILLMNYDPRLRWPDMTAFWDKKNPKKKSTPLTPAQKTDAKRRAKAAGRPYPNLVDNAAAKRKKK